MGCFHSKSIDLRRKTGPNTQPRGTPTPEAESEVHPEIVQLAEVSSGVCTMNELQDVSLFLYFSHIYFPLFMLLSSQVY